MSHPDKRTIHSRLDRQREGGREIERERQRQRERERNEEEEEEQRAAQKTNKQSLINTAPLCLVRSKRLKQ
jgi:hypothetical protein